MLLSKVFDYFGLITEVKVGGFNLLKVLAHAYRTIIPFQHRLEGIVEEIRLFVHFHHKRARQLISSFHAIPVFPDNLCGIWHEIGYF